MKILLALNQSFLASIIQSIDSTPAAVSTLPCTNLINGMRHKICRIFPAGNTATITATMSDDTYFGVIGIGGFTLDADATVQCVLKNSIGSIVYDSSSSSVYADSAQVNINWFSRTKLWAPPSPVVAKSIELTFGTLSESFDISHLVFGLNLPLSVNADWGCQWNWQDTAIQQRTAGGSLLANPSYGSRRLQLSWSNLPNSNWNSIAELVQSRGQSVILSLMPGLGSRQETDLQMIGRLTSAEGINLQGYNLNSLASYVFEEI